jgi:hypothetical protein
VSADRTRVLSGSLSCGEMPAARHPEQDAHDDYSPASALRAGPVCADLSRGPGRPLLRVPAQDPQVRQRRLPFVPVVHGASDGAVEFQRALRQHARLTAPLVASRSTAEGQFAHSEGVTSPPPGKSACPGNSPEDSARCDHQRRRACG